MLHDTLPQNPPSGPNRDGLWLAALALIYLLSRFCNLTLLPVFNDEAVYLHWAKLILYDPANWLISMHADSKKPLGIWLLALAQTAGFDPLWSGRCVSAIAGLAALCGVYQCGKILSPPRAGLVAAALYILSPYHLLFHRIVYEASLLDAFCVWTLWATLRFCSGTQRAGPYLYWLLAGLIGGSLLTISFALLFVFLPLFFVIILRRRTPGLNWLGLGGAYLAGIAVAAVPFAALLAGGKPPSQVNLIIPSTHFLGKTGAWNLLLSIPVKIYQSGKGIAGYFTTYLTWPICLAAAGFWLIARRRLERAHWITAAYFLIPLLLLAGTAGSAFSRYYVFCATPLVLWAGAAVTGAFSLIRGAAIWQRGLAGALLLALLAPAAQFDWRLLTAPETAPFTGGDRYQYVTSEYSGYGVPDAIDFLRREAADKKIIVLTSSNWGNPANAVHVYLEDEPRIKVVMAFWMFQQPLLPPGTKGMRRHQFFTARFLDDIKIEDYAEVYVIRRATPDFDRGLFLRINPNFRLVQAFRKPSGPLFVEVYQWQRG